MNRQRSGPDAAWCPPGTCRLALLPPFQRRPAGCTPRAPEHREPACRAGRPRRAQRCEPSLHSPNQAHDVAQHAEENHLRAALDSLRTHEDLQREDRSRSLPSPVLSQAGLGAGEEGTGLPGATSPAGTTEKGTAHPGASSSQSCHPSGAGALSDALHKVTERLLGRLKEGP